MSELNTFVEELNKTKPLPRTEDFDPIGDSHNNDAFRELSIQLNE
ncbi:MAG: hypothetical protein K0R71_66 [Bacillales bacterium]|jgi:hypothetical protein|nr:hypothetical protein [Bacillales bacterium]